MIPCTLPELYVLLVHVHVHVHVVLEYMCPKISTQDRTARDERTTPEDTAHATAHPDPKATTANTHKPQPPPLSHAYMYIYVQYSTSETVKC